MTGQLVSDIFVSESVNGRMHARTPARVPSYKLKMGSFIVHWDTFALTGFHSGNKMAAFIVH